MADYLTLFNSNMLTEIHNRYVAKDILALNEHTEPYGITLSQKDCTELAESRSEFLIENERIEVGTGAVRRIIEEFCESPYVSQMNFKQTVADLLECFYYIKTETEDRVDDESVIEFLKYVFENDAGGDVASIYLSTALESFIEYGKSKQAGPQKRSEDRYFN